VSAACTSVVRQGSFCALVSKVYAVGAFDDEHVRADGRDSDVGLDQVVVLFWRIVACVKDFEAEDVDVIE
jgi:hypothetical protein